MATSYYAVDQAIAANGTFELRILPFTPRLAPGDLLVAFQRKPDDILFTDVYTISETADREEPFDLGARIITVRTVALQHVQRLEEPRSLIVFAGSLEKVRRFLDPQRHFARQLPVKLSRPDFETIRDGRMHMARSVFRYVFSALPLGVQAEFVRTHIEAFPLTTDGFIRDYGELAPMLLDFLAERMLEPLEMLTSIAFTHDRIKGASLRDLYLLDGTDFDGQRISAVSFGRTCDASRELMKSSRLFASSVLPDSLLDESRVQLGETEANVGERTWTDPIF